MDIVGIDISRAKLDAALLIGERVRHAALSNTEAGFGQFLAWLAKQRPDPTASLHACLEATGNGGLDLAASLHAAAVQVSVVNPVWPAFGRTRPGLASLRPDPARIKAIASRRSACEADGGKAAGVTAGPSATRPTGSTLS